MDKKELIKRYIDQNILRLTSPSTTKKIEKSMRTKYANEYELKSELRFTAKEISEEIANYILRSRSLSKNEFSSELRKIPWMRETLPIEKIDSIYDSNVTGDSLFFKVSDLSKLHITNNLRRIEEEYASRASEKHAEEIKEIEEETKKIKEEYERKNAELDKFKSELNKTPITFKIEEVENEVEKTSEVPTELKEALWWNKVGFPSNPFETNLGLTGISEDKFENIVVKTPLVKKYNEEIDLNPEAFSKKTIMLIGDFGSGKTTIFQYLSYLSIKYNILPINIILNPTESASAIYSQFIEELIGELSDKYSRLKKFDPRSVGQPENTLRYCTSLFKDLQDELPHGFIVFIDGLHQGEAYVDQSLDFLKNLQNILEYLISHSIKVGFFVAGSPRWENELARKPSLTGSYYRRDSIPVLSEEDAIEAVEKRLNLYPTKSSQELQLDKRILQRAFRILGDRLRKVVTFRDFIDHVRGRLELNEFEAVGVSLKIHIETVDAVKAELMRTSIGVKYEAMFKEISVSPQVRIAFKKVVPLILRDGISEEDEIYRKNRGVFIVLKKYDVIVQKKTENKSKFKWFFSDEFAASVLSVGNVLHLSPLRVASAMFEEETLAKVEEANSIYASSNRELNNMIILWKDSNPDVVRFLSNCKEEIGLINKSLKDMKSLNTENIRRALLDLIQAINKVLNPKDSEKNSYDVFVESWVAPENVSEIGKLIDNNLRMPPDNGAVLGLLHNHNEYLLQLLLILSDTMKGESITKLSGRFLSLNQFQAIHRLRMKFLSQSFEDVVDGVCTQLETNIREIIFPCMRAIWGQQAFFVLPKDLQKQIEDRSSKGDPRTKRLQDANFLYSVSRGQYSRILLSKDVFKAVFEDILHGDDEETFKHALDLSFLLDHRLAHRDREEYFRSKATLISEILSLLPWMLEKFHQLEFNFMVECKVSFKNTNDRVFVSFKPDLRNLVNSEEFSYTKEQIKKVTAKILEPLKSRRRPLEISGDLYGISRETPEVYLSVLRIVLSQKLVELERTRNNINFLQITLQGKDWFLKHQNDNATYV